MNSPPRISVGPTRPSDSAALNQLLNLLRYSFPQYMPFTSPYVPAAHFDSPSVLADVAADQMLLADKIAERIDALGESPTLSGFPMEYTDTHDLSIDYLLRRAIRYQRADIETLRQLSASLELSPRIKPIVDEAIGLARGHLECMEECLA